MRALLRVSGCSLLTGQSLSIRGATVEEATREATVEGIPTAVVAVQFADRCGLDLPIFSAVAAILAGQLDIKVGLLFVRLSPAAACVH